MKVSADRLFDASFAEACRVQAAHLVGKPYAGELAFAGALAKVSDLLSDALSSSPERRKSARNRLKVLLAQGE